MRLLRLCLCVGALAVSASALPSERECVEGTTTKDDCNTCTCTNGVLSCTKMACVPDWYLNRTGGGIPDGFECSPGSRWLRECNWCTCTDTGVPACTEKACLPGFEPDPDTPSCEEGSSWKTDECNRCKCINGKQICSKRLCGIVVSNKFTPREEEPSAECQGEGRWRKVCNWCRCRSGKGLCTRRGCPSALMERFDQEPECEGQISFKRDCNSCNCVNGLAVCTKKLCDFIRPPPRVGMAPLQTNVRVETPETEAVCTNGSRWREDCNWCSCGENGLSSCTEIGCIGGVVDEPECEGTSSWKRDCNWCNCNQGRAICTLKACLNIPVQSPAVTVEPEVEAVCTNGSRWRDECNWCSCDENGRAACTLIACTGEVLDEPECEGNSSWKNDCNWCNCHEGRALCTLKLCTHDFEQPPPPSADIPATEAVCTNGSRWREGCNWCSCLENGMSACTLKACVGDIIDEPECEGTSSWKKDCNWCNCVAGRGICTSIACLTDFEQPPLTIGKSVSEAMCTIGSRWRNDCNWCSCTENGLSICTIMGCIGEVTDEPECEGISRWKDDCNWCDCVGGRAICTSNVCPTEEPSQRKSDSAIPSGAECTKGSAWKKNCNWCHCTKNGIGVCTKVGCSADYRPPSGEPQCTKGSRWKVNCNWCHCENGRQSCTEKFCGNDRGESCTEGETFQVDCNTCTCRNGFQVCTTQACPRLDLEDGGDESECREGTSWSEDCNNCHCNNGRKMCTKKLCLQPLPDDCKLPAIDPNAEPCEGFQQKWTFDSAAGQCKNIAYGGCGGTRNLFSSEADCVSACASQKRNIPSSISEGSQEKCLLPLDEGPCFGHFQKFFFNKESGNCESFIYGGCAGNANKFQTAEDCQETCGGVTLATVGECDKFQCPWNRWQHYMAKGCLPQYDSDLCCPTSFSCPSDDETSQKQEKCFYQNKAYDIGDSLEVDHECSTSCRCAPSSLPGGSAEIRCASIECPDLFQPLQPGCRPLYRPGDCCFYDTECIDPQIPPELQFRTPTCLWNNKTYHEGDKMYFDEYPLQKCICTSDFKDPFGAGCSKIDCGLSFRYTRKYDQGCVPIYFEDGCPSDWLCPDDTRIVGEALSQDVSSGTEAVNPCILGKAPGPCHNDVTRIYYDAEASECRQFVYGGCQGNDNNFRTFEECEESCSKTPRPSQSECQVGGVVASGPTEPKNVKVTALLNSGHPGRMSLQVEWSPPNCPKGTIKGYHVWVQKLNPKARPHLDRSYTSKFTGPLITQFVTDGLYLQQPYVIAVAAENNHRVSDLSPLVIFSLLPNYRRPDQCHLGSLSLEVGKSLQLSNCKIDCQCSTPPELTCVEYRSCTALTDNQASKDCPTVKCANECSPVIDALTGCLSCSCQNQSFTCPEPSCPPMSDTSISYQTGCPKCKYQCPLDPSGQPPCPMDCAVRTIIDDITGCQKCECDPNDHDSFGFHDPVKRDDCPTDPPCPMDCAIHMVMDQITHCIKCECDPNHSGNPFNPLRRPLGPHRKCHLGPDGKAPCPMDCAIRRRVDPITGCEICDCDPSNTRNPFNPLIFPTQNICPSGPDGRAPCPMDCAIRRREDPITRCEICECDPNNPWNPFSPPIPPPQNTCSRGPDGLAPCPMDCAIRRRVDPITRCEICECDPSNPGNPFNPPSPPPQITCPRGPDGRAPCPMDCAIRRREDPITRCEICECDPNNPGNPFNPPIPPPQNICPRGPDGRAPCPMDCAIRRREDPITRCEICECDPNNPWNPFNPLIPPP